MQDTVVDIGPLLDAAPCGFVSFADDGHIRAVNATLLEMLGFEREELAGGHIEQLMAMGTRIFYQTHFFPLLRLHGRAEEVFLLLRAKDGSDIGTLANAVRRQRDGEWVSDCIVMQVRERRKFEDALLRARKEAEAAREVAEARGRALHEANELLERQALELEMSQQQLMEQTEELELQGEELRTLNDELLARSEELDRQRTAADEANRAKSAFLAMMSHELRTPLNAIGGYVQLLELGVHGPVAEAQLGALERIGRSQRHLLRLINEVLNLARVESGRVEYELHTFAVTEVVSAVLPMVEPQLAARRLRHEVSVPAELEVYADRDKVQQILLNLLSNATKFTLPGGCVSVTAHAATDKQGRAHLCVRDDGIGIPPDRLEHVFEPFVQVKVEHADRAEGTGLGLAISRDLARGMGGDLFVESRVGAGSTFTLALPIAGG